MARTTRMMFLAAAAALVSAAPALAQDVAKGEQLFRRCAVCHGIGDTTKPIGPNLNNVVGRTAGTLEEFAGKYSPAMVKAGEEGLVWTEADIDEYITNPREKVPGNKMAFPGLRNETERADVIAYLKTFSEAAEEGEAAEPAAAE
jgi:cytochrome c2